MLCDTNSKRWSSRLGSLGPKHANVKIEIDHHFHSEVYTSGSTISGNVIITTQKDLSFDNLEICLTGKSQTQVGLHTPRPLRTSKTFLPTCYAIFRPRYTGVTHLPVRLGTSYTVHFRHSSSAVHGGVRPQVLVTHGQRPASTTSSLYGILGLWGFIT